MIVLDTIVISELMRPQPHPKLLAWVDGLDPARVAITAMNEAELPAELVRTCARKDCGQGLALLQ